jgi:hypothetical protein
MPPTDHIPVNVVDGELAKLLELSVIPSLMAGPNNQALRDWLNGDASKQLSLPPLARSALWLLCGDLDASHEISQTVETPDGSFWHGIMHRREGDFWNAKYWFRRVGPHPVLKQLASTDYGDPQSFVDRCEASIESASQPAIQTCEALQWLEWQLLFTHSLGSTPL